jgi:hypothetical protein
MAEQARGHLMIFPRNRFQVAILAALVVAAGASPADARNRYAFIVGNDAYRNITSLKKAVNDARAVAQSLQKFGFSVSLGENLTRRQFISSFAAFENRIQPGDIAFMFYSGHGVELNGANYLVPVDVPKVAANQQSMLKDEAISTDDMVLRIKTRGARAQVLVLDACRENPFRDKTGRALGGTRGLAGMRAPGGVFIVYSAGVGEVALDRLSNDDNNPNSVFTRSFLPLLADPNRSLVRVVKQTRAREIACPHRRAHAIAGLLRRTRRRHFRGASQRYRHNGNRHHDASAIRAGSGLAGNAAAVDAACPAARAASSCSA